MRTDSNPPDINRFRMNTRKKFNFGFKKIFSVFGARGVIFVVAPPPKIDIILPRTYDKLPCKEKPYQLSG